MSDQIKQIESSYSRQFTQRDVMRNWLFGTASNGGKRPQMRFDVMASLPRVYVKTNDPEDQQNNYGRIDFPIDMPTFFSYVNMVRRFGKGEFEPGKVFTFQSKSRFIGPKRMEEPVPIALLVIGRYKDGRVFTSVFSSNTKRPRKPFFFGPDPEFHGTLVNETHDPVAESEAYALGWADVANYIIRDGLFNQFDQSSQAIAMGEEDRNVREQVKEARKKERGKAFAKSQGNSGYNKPATASAPSVPDFGDDDFADF